MSRLTTLLARLMPSSLRWRLLLLSLLVALPALLWLQWQLSHEFEASVEQRVHKELENHLNQLLARVRALPDGRLRLQAPLSDPRFATPLSGLYWQINDDKGPVLRSRSLWDSALAITPGLLRDGNVHEYELKGPRGEALFVIMRGVWLELPARKAAATPAGAARTTGAASATGNTGNTDSANATPPMRRYIFAVALDHQEITAAEDAFNRQLYTGLALLAAILAIMLVAQVVWGLRPVQRLRQQLEDVRQGRRQALAAPGIDELDPLVQELNSLLKSLETRVEEARARAGNLAHGMKTPLAVLSALARRLRQHGLAAEAEEMEEQIRQLSRHIEHELARSKIHGGSTSHAPRTAAARPLAGIVNALHSLNDTLRWQQHIPPDASVPMEKGDFMELAGNLLENAAKWARSTVRVALQQSGREPARLVIEDDGPGVPPAQYDTILKRGGRLDETVHGNGLGLAIVRDILDSYGYGLRFYRSPLGGLGVEVIFGSVAEQERKSTSATTPGPDNIITLRRG